MKRCELKFLDGPAAGRSIEADSFHPVVWLCEEDGKKWWTFTKPPWESIAAEYTIAGLAPRKGNHWLALYGVVEGDGPRSWR